MQPLREQWDAVKTAAAVHHDADRDDKARAEIEKYHQHLCSLKILDPACGSGNFLYVALARLKELEAEVLDLLEQLGGDRTLEMDSTKVRPSQFLGIEINARAAELYGVTSLYELKRADATKLIDSLKNHASKAA